MYGERNQGNLSPGEGCQLKIQASANKEAERWLLERGIKLEEGFVPALRGMAAAYQAEYGYPRLDDVYRLIGAHKALISYWEAHPHSTQTKKF